MDAKEVPLSHSMAHYLLALHKLQEGHGRSRVTDLARDLGLTKGSVSIAIGNLKKKGLVQYQEGSRWPTLTDKGHREVHRILSCRTLLYYFFKNFVGVDPATAESEACQMEHLMGEQTGVKFFEFMKKLSREGISTDLDLGRYRDAAAFIEAQKGDSHLPETRP